MMIIPVLATAAAVATNLPTVVVEASRLGQTKVEMASHVDVIEKSEIDSSGAQSTVELLEKRANVFIRKMNGNPALAQVSMRGYGANSFGRTKIIVDGEELNCPDMAPQDLLRIPVRSIEKVEILYGPQTVLHGGDASAGVINVVTDSDSYEEKTVLDAHVGNLGQVGTYVATRGGLEEDGLTYFGDFSFDRADGWRRNSWFESWSLKGGVRKNFDNGSWLGVKAFYADTQYGLPGGIYTDGHGSWKDHPKSTGTPHDDARNDVYGFNLSGEGVIDDENKIFGLFSFRNRHSTANYVSSALATETDVYSLDWKLQYGNTSDLFGFGNRFDLGTDHKLDILDGECANRNEYTRYTADVFAREEFFLFEPLSLFCGIRGGWIDSRNTYRAKSARLSDGQTKGDVAGEAGANWRPVDGLKIYVKWSRFYHAPLADEMFSYYGMPNMNLKPESGQNCELGLDWTFLEDFNFNITGYHTVLDDEIMYLNYMNVNAPDETARTGFETSFVWSREKVGSAGVLYSYVHARFTEGDYGGNSVPMVPDQQLRLFGEIYLIDWLAVNGGYRFVGEQRYGGDFSGKGGMLPDFGIFDVGIRVMPSWGWLDGFTLAFTIDNLFDKRYCDYGEYFDPWYVYPAAGRSFTVTLRYEF